MRTYFAPSEGKASSGVLVLGPQEHEQIAAALEKAKARPMPLAALREIAVDNEKSTLDLADRENPELVTAVREEYPPQQLMLGTYRAAISFEEQPLGLTRHLSVSSPAEGMVPGPQVMQMLSEAFGFKSWPPEKGRVFLEEFEPGRQAVNVIEIEE